MHSSILDEYKIRHYHLVDIDSSYSVVGLDHTCYGELKNYKYHDTYLVFIHTGGVCVVTCTIYSATLELKIKVPYKFTA
jgi:hypothetical protein